MFDTSNIPSPSSLPTPPSGDSSSTTPLFDTASTNMVHQLEDHQQQSFSQIVERMTDRQLQDTAEKAGVDVPAGSDWHDYENAFRGVSMKDLDYAVHYGTGHYLNDLA